MKSFAKNYLLKFSILFFVLVVDLVTKHFLYNYGTFSFLPYVLGARPAITLNSGGAWGFLSHSLWLLILITFVFLAVVVFVEVKWKNTHPLYSVALSLIVGGAVGNLIDRIFLGGVRDFIYFEFWPSFPTFNFADCALCIGMVLMVIYVLFVGGEKKVNS